jgi:Putative Ig domain
MLTIARPFFPVGETGGPSEVTEVPGTFPDRVVRMRRSVRAAVALGVMIGVGAVPLATAEAPAAAGGNILYVATAGADSGNCQSSSAPCATISYALSQATPGDTVDVGPGTFAAELSINSCLDSPCLNPLTIEGSDSGTAPATILEPADIEAENRSGSLTLDDLTIDGDVEGSYGTTVSIADSTITNGGVCACQTTSNIDIADSTLSGNGVAVDDTDGSAGVDIRSSTIADNGVGIEGIGFGVSLAGSIIGGNGTDCELEGGSTVTDAGYNLDQDGTCGFSAANHSQSGTNPELGILQNNGGPTPTQAPSLGSPVLNQIPPGTAGLCPGTDQRGVARPQGGGCDIGAVELSVATLDAVTSGDAATAEAGSPFSFTVTTTGSPVPSIACTGAVPKGLGFVDNGNGTATISGTPDATRTRVHHLTIRVRFGKGAERYTAMQSFTLTVT